MVAKFRVGSYFLFLAGHAYVRFVDEGGRGFCRRLEAPDERFFGRIDLRTKQLCVFILNYIPRVCRKPLAMPAFPAHLKTVIIAVFD